MFFQLFNPITRSSRSSKVSCFFAALLLNLIFFMTLNWAIICPTAHALLRQHHETQNVLRYHAQDSLPDSDGYTWQVVLFPDNSDNGETKYYLRLVGFPGIKFFSHPQPLEIITSDGYIFSALDVYAESAPAQNVGQYDLTFIMSKLPSKGSLKLSTILKSKQELALKIPRKVLAEWRLLNNEIEK